MSIVTPGAEARTGPGWPEGIPPAVLREGRYTCRFARDEADVEAALRLRYEVFNLELGEGLAGSALTGLDRDRFDAQCHHLLVLDDVTRKVIGTYRMQVRSMARAGCGFYTEGEFDLSSWPEELLDGAVEIGRACAAKEHRQGPALLALWKGLGAYALHHRKRYFFGCSSLTSQDPAEAARVLEWLKRNGHWRAEPDAVPRPGWECGEERESTAGWESVRLPMLFRTYLRYGAKIVGRPVLDREFKTIDYLALMDLRGLGPRVVLGRLAEDLRRAR